MTKNSTITQGIKGLFATGLVATLVACGGGGGGSSDTATTSSDVTSSGTITGFGSVIVNKVRYATTSARVVRDDGTLIDDSPSDDDLKAILGEGNIVKVRGTRTDDSNGIANTITVDDETVGDIEIGSIDDTNFTFVVNGQTIFVSPDTIIDDSIIGNSATADAAFGTLNTTLDLLLTGVVRVEVAGFPVQGGIQATRIEDFNGSTTAGTGELGSNVDEIKGFVSNLGADSFQINDTIVSFGAGTIFDDDFTLAADQLVEVHGSTTGPTTFDAIRIELEDDLFDDDFSGEFEVEGVIQSIVPDGTGGGDVTINGTTVTVADISALSEGLRIEIKGVLQSNGNIVITRVQDEAEDNIRTEDLVISADASSFQTRLGLNIEPSDRTRLEDDTIDNDDNLSLADFLANVNGQRVEARGFPLSGTTAWTRAEIEDSNDLDCSLRGPAADITGSVSDFTFKIEGVTIDVSQVSDNNFEGANDQPIGRQNFFDQLTAGIIVEATSDANGIGCVDGTLTAREVEFEPENTVLFDDSGTTTGLDNEVFGVVTIITNASFVLGGETISVTDDTLIDDSIVEDARNEELNTGDLPLGGLPETLPDLLNAGSLYVVVVDRSSGSPVALQIED
jgi:hypothetical protein